MSDKNLNNRRQFLKNTSLAAFGLGLVSVKAAASPEPQDPVLCEKTTVDLYGEGPFYSDNPPLLEQGILASVDEPGDRMIISGRVLNLDCTRFIPDAVVDIWHADHDGAYDNEGFNLRGKVTTNSQGFYFFETIKPGKYLNGAAFRPAHIHFKVTAPGFPTLTTQLYFQGDTDIAADAAASVTEGQYNALNRIIPLTTNELGVLEGNWDIAVDGSGTTLGINDLHINRGIIYRVSPNPFSETMDIRYGVYKKAQVSLLVFDIQGRMVATLEERELPAGQYDATWEPHTDLPNGHYFLILKINDLQVHYLKVIHQSR